MNQQHPSQPFQTVALTDRSGQGITHVDAFLGEVELITGQIVDGRESL